jgi:hypothetical protein
MRSGNTIGRRVWMRSRLTCGIVASASVSSASFAVDNDSELYILTKSDGMIRRVIGLK